MTKKALCKTLSTATGLSVVKVKEVLRLAFLQIAAEAREGKSTAWPKFGTFSKRMHKARRIKAPPGRLPEGGAPPAEDFLYLKERHVLGFRPSKHQKDYPKVHALAEDT